MSERSYPGATSQVTADICYRSESYIYSDLNANDSRNCNKVLPFRFYLFVLITYFLMLFAIDRMICVCIREGVRQGRVYSTVDPRARQCTGAVICLLGPRASPLGPCVKTALWWGPACACIQLRCKLKYHLSGLYV